MASMTRRAPALLLCALALCACSDKRDPTSSGSRDNPNGKAGGDAGAPSEFPSSAQGDAAQRPDPTRRATGPSTCALPGEINEFGLPLCELPDAGPDASKTFDCEVGYDEFGRPVCLNDAGEPDDPPPLECRRGGLCQQVTVTENSSLDVLFVVDDSGSMREEQQALVQQMPNLIRVLTSGDLEGDGVQDFPAVTDLHIGVVSSDMGLPGVVGVANCSGLGDDGMLQSLPAVPPAGCAASYPSFLTFQAGTTDPLQLAADFGCIATLGTQGCGYEQQLESLLKAVTPSTSDRRFVADPPTQPATRGQADGPNAGFLRDDSLIALVIVTDEDDCSAHETRLFTPAVNLDPNDPLWDQQVNLRCQHNPQNLFPVSRYISGLREIRPPGSNLVLFAAIVGVPLGLVDDSARAGIDFSDPVARDAYYDSILAAPAMQETVDPNDPTTLVPSCSTATGVAYPPRRIVEVAKAFGDDAVVQSICQSDFAPAMRPIIERISRSLAAGCLPQGVTRGADGLVGCDVIWELPAPGTPGASLETCGDATVLSDPADADLRTSRDGRPRCIVSQVPVTDQGSGNQPEAGASGWFYDDYSPQAPQRCGASASQRIAFTQDVVPPLDVRVFIDCEAQP